MSDEIGRDDNIEALICEVQSAKEAFEAAQEESNIADSHETACLNDLNRAQKALDGALDRLRETMPRESDWRKK